MTFLAAGLAGAASGCKKEEPPEVKAAKQLGELGVRMAEVSAKLAQAQQANGQAPPANPMQAMTEALAKARAEKAGKVIEPVDFRKLRELLPETLAGMKRIRVGGEKVGVMGMTIARADARYEGETRGPDIRVKINDFAGATGVSAMAALGFARVEVDREDENGYEKTVTIGGHKALEKYNHKTKRGRLQILVADRFLTEIETDDMTPEDLRKAVGGLDLAALAALK